MNLLPLLLITFVLICIISASISPIHDMKAKMNQKLANEAFLINSPHKAFGNLDNTILKSTKNVTQNSKMEETLFQISKDLVSSILSKLENQDKITRITREALQASGTNKGITAIETRRILDYISRTLSGNILTATRASAETELQRLVYGLAQIAAEVSIVSALKDITYATALSKKQLSDLSMRRKRSVSNDTIPIKLLPTIPPETKNESLIYNAILNKTTLDKNSEKERPSVSVNNKLLIPQSPYSVIPRNQLKPLNILPKKPIEIKSLRRFLNQTALDIENGKQIDNETDAIIMDKVVNSTYYGTANSQTLDTQEVNAPSFLDDWVSPKESVSSPTINPELVAEMEINSDVEDVKNEKKTKQKSDKLEAKAKKAIIYAGDVAYLTAASVVAMRRALTASIEVQMSIKYAKNGMSNHQELMMNLAKTAAQQAGKEAQSAASKSLACERVLKLAVKYTTQSLGAKLNHAANRIIMDTLSLTSLAKSMAYVSSDIAINSLYQATDIKTPSYKFK